MAVSHYYVGQIPSRPIAIDVRDSNGLALNLSTYTSFKINVIGPNNQDIDTTGYTLATSGSSIGRFVFRWPTDRSVLKEPGEYLLQLEISGAGGTKDYTTPHTIKVRRLGGID